MFWYIQYDISNLNDKKNKLYEKNSIKFVNWKYSIPNEKIPTKVNLQSRDYTFFCSKTVYDIYNMIYHTLK